MHKIDLVVSKMEEVMRSDAALWQKQERIQILMKQYSDLGDKRFFQVVLRKLTKMLEDEKNGKVDRS